MAIKNILGFILTASIIFPFPSLAGGYPQILRKSGQLELIEQRAALSSYNSRASKLHASIVSASNFPTTLKLVAGHAAYSIGNVNWIVLGEDTAAALDDHELLFLLAHESVHLMEFHHEKRFSAVAAIADVSSFEEYDTALQDSLHLLFPQFWREEFHSDEKGMELAIKAGAVPSKAIRLLTKYENDSFHPSSSRRIRNLVEHLKKKAQE